MQTTLVSPILVQRDRSNFRSTNIDFTTRKTIKNYQVPIFTNNSNINPPITIIITHSRHNEVGRLIKRPHHFPINTIQRINRIRVSSRTKNITSLIAIQICDSRVTTTICCGLILIKIW